MTKIKRLPEHLIGQIKAGEVVERPAALIKEILENSLDAGAKNIQLSIVEQGLDLISLEDDGQGMDPEDLPLAFQHHATSKIRKFDDLYALSTFGFRGEALASIASIARVTCTSVPRLADGSPAPGSKIEFTGGVQGPQVPFHSERPGTTLWIRDLFYNTPARLKFIRSRSTEKSAIKKVLQSFLLAHPTVSFHVRWDEKDRESYPAVSDRESRLRQMISPKSWQEVELLSFSLTYEGTTVAGHLSPQGQRPQASKIQTLVCNGRWFEERSLHQALGRAMAPLWAQGESGHYVICLDVPADQVDVNVHPQKTALKFEKMGLIFGLLTQGVEAARAHLKVNEQERPGERLQHAWESGLSSLMVNSETSSGPGSGSGPGLSSGPSSGPGSGPGSGVGPGSSKGTQFLGRRHLLAQGHHWAEILHEGDRSPVLVDSARLFAGYWEASTRELFPLGEAHVSPLLISIPYKDIPENIARLMRHQGLLHNMGLHLDALSDTTLALRSVPKFLALLPYEDSVRALLQHVSEWRGEILNWGDPHLQEFFQRPLSMDAEKCGEGQLLTMARKVAGNAHPPFVALTPETLDGLFA